MIILVFQTINPCLKATHGTSHLKKNKEKTTNYLLLSNLMP